jgi:hypothetical protein
MTIIKTSRIGLDKNIKKCKTKNPKMKEEKYTRHSSMA